MIARREDIPSLTGLRGIAACSVLFAHAMDTSFAYEPILYPISARIAYFGMSLFFVLSGFVIHYNYADLFHAEPLTIAGSRFFCRAARRTRRLAMVQIRRACAVDRRNFTAHAVGDAMGRRRQAVYVAMN
jgi:peptidoglycan/LPS O-acetylase OafA/YrhL